jgi:translation initiation factor 2B subunit (eIF-2B alpha/beta/delta family)
VWWLAARVLVADDPDGEAWRAAEELDDDATSGVLVDALPEDATVTVVGWSETVARALMARGDVRALVVDACGEAAALVRYLTRAGGDAAVVPEGGVGAAAAASDLVVLEASAMGGDGFVALAGSRAAAAVARSVDTQVLAVAPLGHVVPTPMWHALRVVLDDDDPWDDHEEVVPLDVVDAVVRPFGVVAPAEAVAAPDCGMAPELLRRVS